MPVIFTQPAVSRVGESGKLGTPSGGSFDKGVFDFTSDTKVADSINEINEVLFELAPEPPASLDGTELVANRNLHVGRLPMGLSSRWYVGGNLAGNTVSGILEYNNVELSSSDTANRFGKGNKGFLIVDFDDGVTGFTEVASLDIEANFDTSVVGPNVQDLSTWNNQGAGDPCNNAIVTFSGGSLQVTYCGWHNNFNKWQRMNAKINVTGLKEGFSAFRLKHKIGSNEAKSNTYKILYDDDSTPLMFSTNPDLVENTISSNKYLSGIRYYSIGDTFDIHYVANNVYRKCYHEDHVSRYKFDGQANYVNVNPLTIPVYTDSLFVSHTVTIDRNDYYTTDARLVATLYHPWKSSVSATSPSHNILICTYGNVSTDKHEYFLDENYRLPIGNYDTIPSNITGQWNSQSVLTNGNALVFNRSLQYPTQDFSFYWPVGNPNYSGFSGVQKYVRAFSDTNAHNNVVLTLNGIDLNNIGQFGSGDVNVAIKLPTQTGWLDAGRYYSPGDFSGSDGDGCLVTKNGQNLELTFGTISTANSGYMIIVEIRFLNSNSTITEMMVNW